MTGFDTGGDAGETEYTGMGKDASTGSDAGGSITGSKYGRDAGYGTRGSPNRTYSATGESATSASAYAFVFDAFT